MTRRVLIVEDDPELQELYGSLLARGSYEVEPAYDAAEALQSLGRATPDLIILDILLGDISGGEFYRTIKQDPRYASVPVLIATVLPASAVGDLLALDPRTLFLRKPFSKQELLAALDRLFPA